jgi:hypothetical protein
MIERDQHLGFYLNSPIRKISRFISLNPATTPLVPRYGTMVPSTERHRTLRTLSILTAPSPPIFFNQEYMD